MILNNDNFDLYAAKYYDNQYCHDITEFEEDLKRFQYLRKLFGRYKQIGDLKDRLILNHLIIIYNCFGVNATNMLFMKLEEYHELLKPFVEYLNFMTETIEYDGKIVYTNKIISDPIIKETLGEI